MAFQDLRLSQGVVIINLIGQYMVLNELANNDDIMVISIVQFISESQFFKKVPSMKSLLK